MRSAFHRFAALLAVCFVYGATPALAITLNTVAVGGVYDLSPFSGVANGKEADPFIANVSSRRESAVYEFSLAGIPPGTVNSASLTGSVYPNNSFDTGTRIYNFFAYSGNGTIDLADYNIAATSVGGFSHPSGSHTDFNLDAKTALQNLLNAGATHFGIRISAGTDPQPYDILTTSSNPPQLNFSITPTNSTTVSKLPVFDVGAELTGGNYVVTDGAQSISVQRIDFANIDRRGILEFSLSDIPFGSNITSASLNLYINSFGSSPPEYPTLPIYGYAGNGTAEPADATQTATKIADTNEVQSTGPFSIELNAEYIESLLGTGSHFGLLMLGSANYDGVSFTTKEVTSSVFTKPMLSLTYVAPVVGDYNGNGTVGAEDYTTWRTEFGTTGASIADGNTNGVVDAADYVVWRKRLSGPASGAGASVPEPHLFALFFTAAVVASISRRRNSQLNRSEQR
jgi:hypothetical protein